MSEWKNLASAARMKIPPGAEFHSLVNRRENSGFDMDSPDVNARHRELFPGFRCCEAPHPEAIPLGRGLMRDCFAEFTLSEVVQSLRSIRITAAKGSQ